MQNPIKAPRGMFVSIFPRPGEIYHYKHAQTRLIIYMEGNKMIETPVQYDSYGRMLYHPEFHKNRSKPYTVKERAYLCKHYQKYHVKTLALDMGRTEGSLTTQIRLIKASGMFETYRNMDIGEWTPEGE